MNTADFITLIQEDCNGSATRDEIRRLTDIVQQEMLSRDIQYMRAVPDVVIETTNDVLIYQLPDGIRSCVGIYIPNLNSQNTDMPYKLDGSFERFVRNATVTDPGDGGTPTVLFTTPPGEGSSSGVKYACICYKAPSRILDESDVIQVPDPHTTGYLRSRIMEMIEQRRFGNSVYWTPKARDDKGEWLRWANKQQYEPMSGTNNDYLSGGGENFGFGGRNGFGRFR